MPGGGRGPGGKRITKPGYSKKRIGENISALTKAGVPQKQAVAESLGIAREAARKAGKPDKAPPPPKKKSRKKS